MLEEEIIRAHVHSDPRIAWAVLRRLRALGPGLSQPREARVILSGLPEQSSRISLQPWVCDDFLVVDFNHALRRPSGHLAGSAFKEQSAYYNSKIGGDLDVSMDTVGGPRRNARKYADNNNLASVTWRTAGDTRTSLCESCWVLYYCDYASIRITSAQTLPPSLVGTVVILTWLGIEVGKLAECSIEDAQAGLRESGYLDC